MDESPSCPIYSGGCFKYPIRRLQTQDTDNSLSFHINLHVYNNAGHFLSLTTEAFKVPSRYPPSKSFVYDKDPECTNSENNADIDIHFKSNTLCASWTESHHHENVSYEIGIGTTNSTDDIISFEGVKNAVTYCFNSSTIKAHLRYFFVVRASCNGGTTLSSSDGITIEDAEKLRKSLTINVGDNCFESKHDSVTVYSNSSFTWHPNPLLVGQRYSLQFNDNDYALHSTDASITNEAGFVYLTPFSSHVEISIIPRRPNKTLSRIDTLSIHNCPRTDAVMKSDKLPVSWKFDGQAKYPSLAYMIGVGKCNDRNSSLVVPYQPVNHQMKHSLNISGIEHTGDILVAKLKMCSNSHCLTEIDSEPFTIETNEVKLYVDETKANRDANLSCVNINATWRIVPENLKILFHQYSMAVEADGHGQVIPWITMEDSASTIQVQYEN